MRKGIFALIFLTCLGISSLSGCGYTGQEQNLGKKEQETEHGEPDHQEARQQSPQDGNAETGHKASGKEAGVATPAVYMTAAISSDGLMDVYQALQASPEGKVAVKLIHCSHHYSPALSVCFVHDLSGSVPVPSRTVSTPS